MSKIVGSMLTHFQRRLNLNHKNLIHIEGGLGSQILGAIVFWNLQKKLGHDKAKCDLTYFSQEAQRNGLWPYQLDRFNISISEFKKFERTGKVNLLKAKRDFLSDEELTSNYWEKSRISYVSRFPFDSLAIESYFRNLIEINFQEPFAAIHIRRGDYLQVASKIIQFYEYMELIGSIKEVLPNQVVVISDSLIDSEDKMKIHLFLEGKKLMFLDSPGIDPFNVHCLMREASLLITSNSTYSFSAGLLGRQGQIVFSPMQFHSGESSEKYNKTFQSAGTFFIWPKRS
jgi:hypothetical protein